MEFALSRTTSSDELSFRKQLIEGTAIISKHVKNKLLAYSGLVCAISNYRPRATAVSNDGRQQCLLTIVPIMGVNLELSYHELITGSYKIYS